MTQLTEAEQIEIIDRPYPPAAPAVLRCVTCHNELLPDDLFFAKDYHTGLTGWVCQDAIDEHGFARICSLADWLQHDAESKARTAEKAKKALEDHETSQVYITAGVAESGAKDWHVIDADTGEDLLDGDGFPDSEDAYGYVESEGWEVVENPGRPGRRIG